jgi:hypothetical protein
LLSAAVGTGFTSPLVALVKDSFGNTVPGATGDLHPPGDGRLGHLRPIHVRSSH